MQIKSSVTGFTYYGEDMVYIVNSLQAAKYLKNGAVLYDVFESRNMIVFAFNKNETKDLYDRWCKRELN